MQAEYIRANRIIGIEDEQYPEMSHQIDFIDYCCEANGEKNLELMSTDNYPILINPHSSDEQLSKDILTYVHQLREKLNINANEHIKVDYQTLQKWASYQLLAIIDLEIWAYFNNYKLTSAVLCASVFKSGVAYGESNLKKSIQPIIDCFLYKIGTSKYEKALKEFVASEIWKHK